MISFNWLYLKSTTLWKKYNKTGRQKNKDSVCAMLHNRGNCETINSFTSGKFRGFHAKKKQIAHGFARV